MEQINEYSKDVVDRFIRSMGYDPAHIDRNKRMAFTKTTRFQQFAARMAGGGAGIREGLSSKTLKVIEQSSTTMNRPYTKGTAQTRTHAKDMALKRSVHVNKPQLDVKTENVTDESCGCDHKKELSKSASVVKSLYKKKTVKEELYDHEKDDKDGKTYGKKPKFKPAKDEGGVGDGKAQSSATLSGGNTLTGQDRDTVEIDPVLKRAKPGSPNSDSGDEK
jgi:hypothetical protein